MFSVPSLWALGPRPQRYAPRPTLTYDLGLSSGTYNGSSYTELNLGLNWRFMDNLIWRNSVFSRSGTNVNSGAGLDSSARVTFDLDGGEQGLRFNFYAGPGIRLSNKENTGIFGEAGITARIAGLAIGLGYKTLQYNDPGTNSDGTDRSKTDSTISIIIAGGGAF